MIVLTRRITDPGTLAVSGTVTLDVDSRIKSRLRVTLDDGREAGSCWSAATCCAGESCLPMLTAAS